MGVYFARYRGSSHDRARGLLDIHHSRKQNGWLWGAVTGEMCTSVANFSQLCRLTKAIMVSTTDFCAAVESLVHPRG